MEEELIKFKECIYLILNYGILKYEVREALTKEIEYYTKDWIEDKIYGTVKKQF